MTSRVYVVERLLVKLVELESKSPAEVFHSASEAVCGVCVGRTVSCRIRSAELV